MLCSSPQVRTHSVVVELPGGCLGIYSLRPHQHVAAVWGMGRGRVKEPRQVIMSLISPCDLIKM